jgi:fructose-bisphosphate aldolase class II
VAIGNLHGLYPVPKHLDLERLERIRRAVPCYLSLHGGSGIRDDEFRGAVGRDTSKININTEMRKAFRTALERQLAARPDEYAIIRLMGPVIDAVHAVVEHKMEIRQERLLRVSRDRPLGRRANSRLTIALPRDDSG